MITAQSRFEIGKSQIYPDDSFEQSQHYFNIRIDIKSLDQFNNFSKNLELERIDLIIRDGDSIKTETREFKDTLLQAPNDCHMSTFVCYTANLGAKISGFVQFKQTPSFEDENENNILKELYMSNESKNQTNTLLIRINEFTLDLQREEMLVLNPLFSDQ